MTPERLNYEQVLYRFEKNVLEMVAAGAQMKYKVPEAMLAGIGLDSVVCHYADEEIGPLAVKLYGIHQGKSWQTPNLQHLKQYAEATEAVARAIDAEDFSATLPDGVVVPYRINPVLAVSYSRLYNCPVTLSPFIRSPNISILRGPNTLMSRNDIQLMELRRALLLHGSEAGYGIESSIVELSRFLRKTVDYRGITIADTNVALLVPGHYGHTGEMLLSVTDICQSVAGLKRIGSV